MLELVSGSVRALHAHRSSRSTRASWCGASATAASTRSTTRCRSRPGCRFVAKLLALMLRAGRAAGRADAVRHGHPDRQGLLATSSSGCTCACCSASSSSTTGCSACSRWSCSRRQPEVPRPLRDGRVLHRAARSSSSLGWSTSSTSTARTADVTYSDMNGFGHFLGASRGSTRTGRPCAVLLAVAGYAVLGARHGERLARAAAVARARFTPPVASGRGRRRCRVRRLGGSSSTTRTSSTRTSRRKRPRAAPGRLREAVQVARRRSRSRRSPRQA